MRRVMLFLASYIGKSVVPADRSRDAGVGALYGTSAGGTSVVSESVSAGTRVTVPACVERIMSCSSSACIRS